MALNKGEVKSGGRVLDSDARTVVVGPGVSTGSTAGALTANPSRPSEAKTPKSKITAKSAESKDIAAANESRVALYISNTGANDIWLAFGAAAVAEEGPTLKKEGGSIVIDNFSGKVACITKSGESVVSFSEI